MSFAEQTYVIERVAAGKVPGATAVYLNGSNPTPTTTFETAWDNSSLYVFLTTNMSSPTIVSASANDAAAGTGIRTVRISGVDSTYTAQTEDVTMNGTTPVALTKNYRNINSIVALTAGSGGVAAGNITLAAAAVTHGFILAGRSQMNAFMYTVPANNKLLVFDLFANQLAASAGGSTCQIMYSTNGGPQRQFGPFGMPTNVSFTRWFPVPMMFPEKTQVQGQVLSAAATSRFDMSGTAILLDQSQGTTDATNWAKWI